MDFIISLLWATFLGHLCRKRPASRAQGNHPQPPVVPVCVKWFMLQVVTWPVLQCGTLEGGWSKLSKPKILRFCMLEVEGKKLANNQKPVWCQRLFLESKFYSRVNSFHNLPISWTTCLHTPIIVHHQNPLIVMERPNFVYHICTRYADVINWMCSLRIHMLKL